MPDSETYQIDIPSYGVVAQEFGEHILLFLTVTTSGTDSKFFLCTSEQNFQAIAKQIHDGIVRAGQEARRAKSGLITVRDLPDSLKKGGRNGTVRLPGQAGQGRVE